MQPFWSSSRSPYQPVSQDEKLSQSESGDASNLHAETGPQERRWLGKALLCLGAANVLIALATLVATRGIFKIGFPVSGVDVSALPRPDPYVGLQLYGILTHPKPLVSLPVQPEATQRVFPVAGPASIGASPAVTDMSGTETLTPTLGVVAAAMPAPPSDWIKELHGTRSAFTAHWDSIASIVEEELWDAKSREARDSARTNTALAIV
ncbi:hypothetical protein B0H11DRAFT_2292965 [Mycena galericulata]|nr:hypothetical protein B0H11DRAFT_2292965 [Mycena galericulata]